MVIMTAIMIAQFNGNLKRRHSTCPIRGRIVATGGPMQNEKRSETRNASMAFRHGVCHDTPLKLTVTTAAAETRPTAILNQYRSALSFRIAIDRLLVAADAPEPGALRQLAGRDPRLRLGHLPRGRRVRDQAIEIAARLLGVGPAGW